MDRLVKERKKQDITLVNRRTVIFPGVVLFSLTILLLQCSSWLLAVILVPYPLTVATDSILNIQPILCYYFVYQLGSNSAADWSTRNLLEPLTLSKHKCAWVCFLLSPGALSIYVKPIEYFINHNNALGLEAEVDQLPELSSHRNFLRITGYEQSNMITNIGGTQIPTSTLGGRLTVPETLWSALKELWSNRSQLRCKSSHARPHTW